MKSNRNTLQKEIDQMESVYNDPSTSAEVKKSLESAIEKAKKHLSELPAEDMATKPKETQKKKKVSVLDKIAKKTQKPKSSVTEEEKLSAEIAEMKKVHSSESTPADVKSSLETAIKKAEEKLSSLKNKGEEKKQVKKPAVAGKKVNVKTLLKSPSVRKAYAGSTKGNILRDAERKALKPGKRVTSHGTVYWESRSNRSDLSSKGYPYLESGGMLKMPKSKEKRQEDIAWLKDFIERWDDAKQDNEINQLIDEYAKWVSENDYPHLSADELLIVLMEEKEDHADMVSEEKLKADIAYLRAFERKWDDKQEKREDTTELRNEYNKWLEENGYPKMSADDLIVHLKKMHGHENKQCIAVGCEHTPSYKFTRTGGNKDYFYVCKNHVHNLLNRHRSNTFTVERLPLDGSEENDEYAKGGQATAQGSYSKKIDKEHKAKPVGYRFTNMGARRLGKRFNAIPTKAEIEKYGDKTFKVKGLTHYYIYQESRKDKSDVSKSKPYLEQGGELIVADGNEGKVVTKGNFVFYFNKDNYLIEIYHKPTDLELFYDKRYMYSYDQINNKDKNNFLLVMTHPLAGEFLLRNGFEIQRQQVNYVDGSNFADGGNIAENYSAEVGNEKITVIKKGKEKTGYPVYVRLKGYAPVTIDVYDTKEIAETKARKLEKENKYAGGGSIKTIPSYFGSGENINVFGYQTQAFDVCGAATKEFNDAIAFIVGTFDDTDPMYVNMSQALRSCAEEADYIFQLEKLLVENGNDVHVSDFELAVFKVANCGMLNYKAASRMNLSFFGKHIFEISQHVVADQVAPQDIMELESNEIFSEVPDENDYEDVKGLIHDSLPELYHVLRKHGFKLNQDTLIITNEGYTYYPFPFVWEEEDESGEEKRNVTINYIDSNTSKQYATVNIDVTNRTVELTMPDEDILEKIKYASGGSMPSEAEGYIDVTEDLENFDLENLDLFESMQFAHLINQNSKVEALQILINNAGGDFSQLDPALALIAEKQDNGMAEKNWEEFKEYAKGGAAEMYEGGGEVSADVKRFHQQVKDALKQKDKWHFITEKVDGKDVYLKMFPGQKEVDVQRYTIDGIHQNMPRNYSRVRDTERMIMTKFIPEFEEGGYMEKGGVILNFPELQVKVVYNKKFERWEGLQRAINPKTKQPLQNFAFDRDSMIGNSKDEVIAKYEKEYGTYEYGGTISNEDGGYMHEGGKIELKEDDYVWNAAGKKLIVHKVTDDEYLFDSFGSPALMPFSKQKVHNYIRTGQWILPPTKDKMASGGQTSDDKFPPITFYFPNKEEGRAFHKKMMAELGSANFSIEQHSGKDLFYANDEKTFMKLHDIHKKGASSYSKMTKDWEVVYISMQGKTEKKKITLGRMSDTQDVKEALKRMNIGNIKEVVSIKEVFATGGFARKVKAISKRLTGTKVPKKYQKDYGKRYSKEEATNAGQRIAGKMRQEMMEKNKGKKKKK